MRKFVIYLMILLSCVIVCSCGENKLEGRYDLVKLEIDGVGMAPMGTDNSYLDVNKGLSTIYLSLGDSCSILNGYIGNY